MNAYSTEERTLLLRVAHDAIAAALYSQPFSFEPPSPHLAEARGVFTSLYRQGNLRGCVGYFLPSVSVYRAVAETACGAAFEDSRFPAVTEEELPLLRVELSILTHPQPIEPEAIQIGRHGLLISLHKSRGLLLPQVAAERGWNVSGFLEQTCQKAGLASDAWRKGATIEAFTAEIFGDTRL